MHREVLLLKINLICSTRKVKTEPSCLSSLSWFSLLCADPINSRQLSNGNFRSVRQLDFTALFIHILKCHCHTKMSCQYHFDFVKIVIVNLSKTACFMFN